MSEQGMRCDAQYGSDPDLCYLQFNHRGPHSNRFGTTWDRTPRPPPVTTQPGGCTTKETRMAEHTLTEAEVARFWALVDKSDGCWQWRGYTRFGYGRFAPRHRADFAAHRVSYELLVGSIPAGLTLDHTCHTESDCPGGDDCPHRSCVNPAHLEPVTMRANTLRSTNSTPGINARKTRCIRDHPLEGDNLIVYKNGHRACRTCKRVTQLAYYHRQKEVTA